MSKDYLRYDKMVEGALRSVVREALQQVALRGLHGDHHFYLTFRTHFPGLHIPEYLRSRYPHEMTVVLQYQFFGLELLDDAFTVSLSFSGSQERIVIPFAAITTFADPSVNFALQFQPLGSHADDDDTEAAETVGEGNEPATVTPLERPAASESRSSEGKASDSKSTNGGEVKRGEVVTLDAFRKK